MKSIIIPTDFSPAAENATVFACEMAEHLQASIRLLHVYQLPISLNDVPMPLISEVEMHKASDEKLNRVKEMLIARYSSLDMQTESRLGDVVDELENICSSEKPFAIVIGSDGSGILERALFGSTTLRTIRHLQVPVIVISKEIRFRPVKKICLACDFRDVENTTPEKEIRSIVNAFNAELHVVNVVREKNSSSANIPEQSFLLHSMISDLNPQYHFVDRNDVDGALTEFAETQEIDLMIVIPKKHSMFEGLFHKSHTKELSIHAHMPVMAIHG